MKVAICLSGQMRNWDLAKENQKWFWSSCGGEVDYFIHTWDYSGDREGVSMPYKFRKITDDEYNRYIEFYEPKAHIFDKKPQSFFYDNDHWSSLFYSFSQSILLKRKYEIENNFEYDIVVKSRPDLVFEPSQFFVLNLIQNNVIYTTHGGLLEHEFNMFNINDCTFYSDSYTMDLLINVYFYRQKLINEKVNGGKNVKPIGPGVLMHDFCREYGITAIPAFNFLETIVKDGCPTNLDLFNSEDFIHMENYFRNWYLR